MCLSALLLWHGNCSNGAHLKKRKKKAKSGSEFFASVVKLFIFSCLKPTLKRSSFLHHPQPFLLLLIIARKNVSVHLHLWVRQRARKKWKTNICTLFYFMYVNTSNKIWFFFHSFPLKIPDVGFSHFNAKMNCKKCFRHVACNCLDQEQQNRCTRVYFPLLSTSCLLSMLIEPCTSPYRAIRGGVPATSDWAPQGSKYSQPSVGCRPFPLQVGPEVARMLFKTQSQSRLLLPI